MQLYLYTLFLLVATPTSGVLTYKGLISQFGTDDWWAMTLAALTSASVVLALFVFWSSAMETVPQIKNTRLRRSAWATILGGSIFIASLSSYWNVLALTENEVKVLILEEVAAEAEAGLNQAIHEAGRFSAANGRLASLHANLRSMRIAEGDGTGPSGAQGTGPIYALLLQLEGKAGASIQAMTASTEESEAISQQGLKCLADLREAIQLPNAANLVARKVSCVNKAIADLSTLGMGDQISGSMADMTAGAVIPSSARSPQQIEGVARILAGVQEQADRIALFAERNKGTSPYFVRTDRPNPVEAIIRYWRKLAPAISTALALDWLPVLLLIFLSLRQRDSERRGRPTGTLTAAQLHDAEEHLKWLQTPVERRPGGSRIRKSRK